MSPSELTVPQCQLCQTEMESSQRKMHFSGDALLSCGREMPNGSCPRLYLQVQGMLQLQPVKLLILQLEEILTVGKAFGQLWEETQHIEDGTQTSAKKSR